MGKYNNYNGRIPRDYSLPEERIIGEKKIINCRVMIDRKIFRKSPEEKLKLKIAKSQYRRQ
jgi:hypothetical protein